MRRKGIEESKFKVLVIDDELDLCRLFERILGKEGYSVILAYNGFEGIKRIEDSKPDVIILDLKMPKMNGMEALRNIRKVHKDVPIIILTGYGSAGTVREAVDLNVYEYISKPFKTEVIKRVVREALASRGKREENE